MTTPILGRSNEQAAAPHLGNGQVTTTDTSDTPPSSWQSLASPLKLADLVFHRVLDFLPLKDRAQSALVCKDWNAGVIEGGKLIKPVLIGISDLPNELIWTILAQTNVVNTVNASTVCRQWDDVAHDEPLWKHILLRDFPDVNFQCVDNQTTANKFREATVSRQTLLTPTCEIHPSQTFQAHGNTLHPALVRSLKHVDGTLISLASERGDFVQGPNVFLINRVLKIWQLETGWNLIKTLINITNTDHFDYADGKLYIVTIIDGLNTEINIYDLKSKEHSPTKTIKLNGNYHISSFHYNDGKLYIGTFEGLVEIHDLSNDKVSRVETSEGNSSVLVSFIPLGNRLVTCHDQEMIKIWDLTEHGSFTKSLEGASQTDSKAYSIIHANGMLYTGHEDGKIRCWDIEDVNLTGFMKGHAGTVTCLAFDEGMLFSCAGDDTIRIWNVKNNRCVRVLNAPATTSLECRDGMLIAGNKHGKIRVWDLNRINITGEETQEQLGTCKLS